MLSEGRLELIEDGRPVRSSVRREAARWYTQTEVQDLFEAAGLADVALHADFTWATCTGDERIWTALGRRP
jgi:SAM-dependent MidA family methyltransferase